ncbi:MAG: hypothetical protein RIT45_366 [Pseudomonadota bacterium]|jgi:Asp-tRNA(Asn)/Glu-tRNA(Gln) amidotransferase A subunit family amidase
MQRRPTDKGVRPVLRSVLRPLARGPLGRRLAPGVSEPEVVVEAPTGPLLTAGAVELAAMIRRREVSPREVLQADLDRIDAVNPQINAVVEFCRERAFREADAWGETVRHARDPEQLRHGADALRAVLGFTYCAMFNPLELPATAVPAGFSSHGLPLGVQVVGRRNNDHLTLWVAARIEEALGGWQPAPIRGDR